MIKKEMITQKGNKLKVVVETEGAAITIKLYNNGSLAIESKQAPRIINEITVDNYKELSSKGAYAILGSAYINEDTYELVMSAYSAMKKENEQAIVTFRVMGWESIDMAIDTKKDVDQQLHQLAKKYNLDFAVIKSAYEKSANAIKVTETPEQKELKKAQEIIKKAASQEKVMTDAEYRIWAKNYNNVYNEGGEGYIPELITKERLERAREIIKQYS